MDTSTQHLNLAGIYASAEPNTAGCYAVAIIMPVFGTLFILARFLAKRIRERPITTDDWFLLAGLFFVWALSIELIVGTAIGAVGRHTAINPTTHQDIIDSHARDIVKVEFAFLLTERLAFGSIKMGIVFWYRLIFDGRAFNILSLSVLIFLGMWTTAYFFATAFQCGSDITNFWGTTASTLYQCVNTEVLQVSYTVTDVFTDLVVLAIPIPFLWKLQMKKSKKIGLILTFLLGLLSTAAGAVKMAMWIWLTYTSTVGYRDLQGYVTTALVWALVSAGIALIAACLPSLRPLTNKSSADSIVQMAKSTIELVNFSPGASHRGSDTKVNKDTVPDTPVDDTRQTELGHRNIEISGNLSSA